jgi:hypothetical protein
MNFPEERPKSHEEKCTFSTWEKPKFPNEKKLPWGAMNFLWGRAQVPQGESHLPHGPMYFERERLIKFLKKIYVPNFLQSEEFYIHFYISL